MVVKRKGARVSTNGAKKQKLVPSAEDLKEFCTSTLKLVNELTSENDRPLAEPFVKLPSKKLYPDYYVVVTSPMTISDIQRKLSKGKYTDSEVFLDDFKLIYDNAVSYNDPESWLVADASKLYEFVKQQVESFEETTEKDKKKKSKKESDDLTFNNLPQVSNELLTDVIDHEFPELGVISGPFIEDIDPKEYPEYFKIIKKPTSFNNVTKKINTGKLFSSKISILDNLQRLHDAVSIIFTNAQTFNDPSSLIYQDSVKLQEYFEEKYEELKSKADETKKSKIKLKIKNPEKDQHKVKLNLKFKGSEEAPESTGRKRKVKAEEEVIESEKDVEDDNDAEMDVALDNDDDDDDDTKVDHFTEQVVAAPSHIMGKSQPSSHISEFVIREVILSTSLSQVSPLTQQVNQQAQQVESSNSLTRAQLYKQSLFPSHSFARSVAMFDYRFPATGYASSSYTVSLPPDTSPILTFKISLHSLLLSARRPDLTRGLTLAGMGSDQDFQCSLHVNEDEVTGSGEIIEEKDGNNNSLLGIQYELKLSYGLNILSFELKVAPSLSKKLKNSPPKEEEEETSGRHTRHQLQQMKMLWDVEQVNMFVICNSV